MVLNFKKKHPIILINFLPRMIGEIYLALIIVSCMLARDAMTSEVIAFIIVLACWPFIALYWSVNTPNPKHLEFNFVCIDGVLIGISMAILGFALWPVVAMWISLMVSAVSLNGLHLGLRAALSIVFGVLVGLFFYDFYIDLATDLRTTIICVISLCTFTLLTGFVTYFRNRVGKNDRVQLRAALSELDHINKILHESSSSLKLDNVTRILVDSLKNNVFKFDTLILLALDNDEHVLKIKLVEDSLLAPAALESLHKMKIKLTDHAFAVDVLQSRDSFYLPNIEEEEFSPTDRLIKNVIFCQSVIMFPLVIKNKAIGVIGFYNRGNLDLHKDQIDMALNYINQVALTINNAILHDQISNKQREISKKNKQLKSVSTQLAKYIPPQLFDKIMQGEMDYHVGAQKKMLTIFFSDIVSFTEMPDRMESDKLTAILNSYLDAMTKIALSHGGTIDKYIGDALMVFFGDPSTLGAQQDATACALMALEMRDTLSSLRENWEKAGAKEALQIRVGMHTGYCAVGNFGSEFRMDYTIIGSSVNLASRLLTSGMPGQIVISEETYALINDKIVCKENGMVRVKGFAQPIKTYVILDAIVKSEE